MSRPLDVETIARLEQQLAQFERIGALHGRVFLGIVADGIRVLLTTAQAGDGAAQTELAQLRQLLNDVLREDDSRSRIAVIRSNRN